MALVTAAGMLAQARRQAGRVVRLAMPRPLILMYHRVAELPCDPQLLAVHPRRFAEQLEVLRRHFRPLALPELHAALAAGRLPRNSIVVTIDDGYADSLHAARPLLERFDVPATVFVASGYVGGTREFWWDELERLLLLPGRMPGEVRLSVNGHDHDWQLDGAADYSPADYERDATWHVEQDHDPTARHRLYRSVYELLHPLADEEKWQALGQLRQATDRPDDGRPTHRTLTHDELVALGEGGLVEIGAHSVTHPALADLSVEVQHHEVAGSKSALESLLGRRVAGFAYPHGSYSADTVGAVAAAGFRYACTSDPTPVGRRADVLRLPRLVPRDWDGDVFARWLRQWLVA